tara:strand:+ start:494 stop:841 length:348 start_codon:yes stop_codon:yes gene_type:complete
MASRVKKRTEEKIIKIALLSQFTEKQVEGILEVVNASNDPAVATEIILGVYEAPTINKTHPDVINKDDEKRNKTNFELLYFSPLENSVSYSFVTSEGQTRTSVCHLNYWQDGKAW